MQIRYSTGTAFSLSNALYALNQFPAATKILRRILKTDPAQHIAYNLLALILRAEGRLADSINTAHRAIALHGTEPEYWHTLATSCYYAFRYAEAIQAFERCLELRPNHVETLSSLFYTKQMVCAVQECFLCSLMYSLSVCWLC